MSNKLLNLKVSWLRALYTLCALIVWGAAVLLLTACTKQPQPEIQVAQVLKPDGKQMSLKGGNRVHLRELNGHDVLDIQTSQQGVLESVWNCRLDDNEKTSDSTTNQKISKTIEGRARVALNTALPLFAVMPEQIAMAHNSDKPMLCDIHLSIQQQTQANYIVLTDVKVQRAQSSGLVLTKESVTDFVGAGHVVPDTPAMQRPVRLLQGEVSDFKIYWRDNNPATKNTDSNKGDAKNSDTVLDASTQALAEREAEPQPPKNKKARLRLECADVQSSVHSLQENEVLPLHKLQPHVLLTQAISPLQRCRVVVRDTQRRVKYFSAPVEFLLNTSKKLKIEAESVLPEYGVEAPSADRYLQPTTYPVLKTWQCYDVHRTFSDTGPVASFSNWKMLAARYIDRQLQQLNQKWSSLESTQRVVRVTNTQKFSQSYQIARALPGQWAAAGGVDMGACVQAYKNETRAYDTVSGKEVQQFTLAPGEGKSLTVKNSMWHPCSVVSRVTHYYANNRAGLRYYKAEAFAKGAEDRHGTRFLGSPNVSSAVAALSKEGSRGACMASSDEDDATFKVADLGVWLQLVTKEGEVSDYRQPLIEASVLTLRRLEYLLRSSDHRREGDRLFYHIDLIDQQKLGYKQ